MKAAVTVFCVCVSLGGVPGSVEAQGTLPEDPIHFRLDQVPIACSDISDCPSGALCFSGTCRYLCASDAQCPQIWMESVSAPTVYCSSEHLCETYLEVQDDNGRWLWTANVPPPTRSYVAPNRNQAGAGCYAHAPMQAFQTQYAVQTDLQGWYDWGPDDLDRSILMSPLPFWQCAGISGEVIRFLDHGGLVDMCHEPYWKRWTTADTCGYYGRYMSLQAPWPSESPEGPYGSHIPYRPACSAPQQAASHVLVYRSSGWSDKAYGLFSMNELADLVRQHGPLVTDGASAAGAGHAITVIGYDLRPGQYGLAGIPLHTSYSNVICYQNSDGWSDDRGQDHHGLIAVCKHYDESDFTWYPLTSARHVESVRPPAEYIPGQPGPFHEWMAYARSDQDGDGILDSQDPDIDGDAALNEFDPAPYNPYQRIDSDGDGLPEPRLVDPIYNKFALETCLAWCRSMDLLTTFTGQWQGGGQGCQDRCRGFDRCITMGIKNVEDNQCDWRCVATSADTPCHPVPGAEFSDCCNQEELDLLDTVCRPLYHNVSNVDSDAQNPNVDDRRDEIADVCEEAGAALPVMSLDEVVTIVPYQTPGGIVIRALGDRCTEWRVKIETGFYGGSLWVVQEGWRKEIAAVIPTARITELGVCGCDADETGWSACRSRCPETHDDYGYPPTQVWQDIDSPQCADFNDVGMPPGNSSTICNDKAVAYSRDEDCSDGSCNMKELYWSWRDDPNTYPGKTIKARVGLRLFDQGWTQNVLYPSVSSLVLPDPAYQCSPILPRDDSWHPLELDGWQHRIPHEPPNLPLGGRLGSLAVARDVLSSELWVFEFDKQLRGPLNPKRVTYAGAETPRIEGEALVVALGRVGALAMGSPEKGKLALFALSRRMVGGPTPSGGGSAVLSLWVAGLDEEQRELRLAEELFGPSGVTPPAMASPVAVWDSVTSRLFVAGGGEQGRFGLWAYLPEIGQWKEIPTPLPADQQGVAMVADPVMHRIYLSGSASATDQQPALFVVDTATENVSALAPLPPGMDRENTTLALDPFNRLLYLYGGRRGTQVLGDLWQLDLRSRQWLELDDGNDPSGPGPREGAQMLFERRYGRIWISGGQDNSGPKLPTLWAFSAAMNLWHEQPLGPEPSPEGDGASGVFYDGNPALWKVSIPDTTPLPGRLIKLTLMADDPCTGMQIWDEAGERLARTLHCALDGRSISLLGQPGETYWVVLEALPGFASNQGSTYELRVGDASLVAAASLSLADPGVWPQEILAEASPTRPVGYALLPDALVSVDLTTAESANVLDSLALPRGEATGLVVDRRQALVSMNAPGGADLVQVVGLSDPADLRLTGEIRLPGQAGRLLAYWTGGQVYAAKSGKVEIVDLMDPAGPTPAGSINVGAKITCLHAHGDRLYVCTMARRLKVYALGRQQAPQILEEKALGEIGQAIRVHGHTVHVAELDRKAFIGCTAGGPCNSAGTVEVFRHGEDGTLGRLGDYSMRALALPHLALGGDVAARSASGGIDLYRVEVAP